MRVRALELRIRRIEGSLRRDPKTWTICIEMGADVGEAIREQTKGQWRPGDRVVIREYGIGYLGGV